jgi:hypothetical protein
MPVSSPLSMIAACAALLVTPCAQAADLAAHSRIGTIFAEPPERVILPPYSERNETNAIVAESFYAFQPRIPGYYGRAGDFYYRSYYGTPPETIFGRDPYACTNIGWC